MASKNYSLTADLMVRVSFTGVKTEEIRKGTILAGFWSVFLEILPLQKSKENLSKIKEQLRKPKKNPRTKPEKLELKKYDPKARKHVLFREAKIK